MLQTFQYVELNCFSLVILFLILLNMRHPSQQYLTDQKLFLSLILTVAALLMLDTAMWIFDGKPGTCIRVMYVTATVLYNILNGLVCMIWFFYVDFYIYGKRHEKRKYFNMRRAPILLPVVLNTILSVASIFKNIYYIMDADNVYHHGRFVLVLLGICLYMVAYTTVFLVRNRKKLAPREFLCLLFFAVPPSIGGVVQALHYGTIVIWACVTVSILIIFINVQNNQLVIDYLTGLYNRRYLDFYLESKLQTRNHGKFLAGMMIDLNSFKMINDLYGHHSGDQALQDTAAVLKKTFGKDSIIARYGGDEFVIVLEILKREELDAMACRLRENIMRLNLQMVVPYEISLSVGYDTYIGGAGVTVPEFLSHIDRLMYIDKQRYICRLKKGTMVHE